MEDLRELLKVGRVAQLVDGDKYYVLPDRLIGCNDWMRLSDYSKNLECNGYEIGFNISKIFNAPMDKYGCWNFGMDKDEDGLEIIWERPKEKVFSDNEIIIAKNINKEYKYIARDKDEQLYVYSDKPFKEYCTDVKWSYGDCMVLDLSSFEHLFQQIQWKDKEPTLISDIINSKNCQ